MLEVAGLVVAMIGTAIGGIPVWWAWGKRRSEADQAQEAAAEDEGQVDVSTLITDPAEVRREWLAYLDELDQQDLASLHARVETGAFTYELIEGATPGLVRTVEGWRIQNRRLLRRVVAAAPYVVTAGISLFALSLARRRLVAG